MVFCNTTLEDLTVDGEEKYSSIGLTFHEIGLILSAVFGLVSIAVAGVLIFLHATHYLRPEEQKHIIRILLMIPIYSAVSFLSYYYYLHSIYFAVLRDCYEAFAIASFFTLICNYVAPNLHDQKEYFRTARVKNWIWPIPWIQKCTGGENHGPLRKPKSGLTWFNVIYVCIFQYCFIRVLCTVISVISEATGRYCEDSLSPAFAHVWVDCFECVSVSIAMYALIQFFYQLRQEIIDHRPILKLICIKLVIFFSFWQSLVISFLVSHGTVNPGRHIKYPDLSIGLPSMLLCIEMSVFATLHIWAFPWREYLVPGAKADNPRNDSAISYEQGQDALNASGSGFSGTPKYKGGPLGLKAIASAFNPWDIIKASARGFRWLFVGRRRRFDDPSYRNQQGLEPLGTELKDQTHSYPGPLNGPNGDFKPSAQQSGGNERGQTYQESSPYRTGPPGAPPNTWQPNTADHDPWRPTISPNEDSRRPTPDNDDGAGLLKYAVPPSRVAREIS